MEGDGEQVVFDEIAGLRGGELTTAGVEVSEFLAVVDDGLGDLVDQRRIGLLVREQRRVRAGDNDITLLAWVGPGPNPDGRPERRRLERLRPRRIESQDADRLRRGEGRDVAVVGA